MNTHWLVQDIAETLDAPDESRIRGGRLYASSAALCPRKEAFNNHPAIDNGMEQQSVTRLLYTEIGHTIESVLIAGFGSSLVVEHYKVNNDALNLGGEIDAIIRKGDHLYIVEIKSCGAVPVRPKAAHVRQAQVYAALTGLPAVLLYWSRNVESWKAGRAEIAATAFDIDTSSETLQQVMRNVALSRIYTDLTVNPPMPDGMRKTVDCAYCPYYSICWDNGTPLYDNDATEAQVTEASRRAADFAARWLATMDKRRELFKIKVNDDGR